MDVHADLPVGKLPTSLFTRPAAVEVVGARFDRPPNSRYYTLRFPRVLKIHYDRTIVDATDSAAYQLIAEQSRVCAGHEAVESYELWLNKLGFDNFVDESCLQTSLETSQNTQHTSPYPVAGLYSDKELAQSETSRPARCLTKRIAFGVPSQSVRVWELRWVSSLKRDDVGKFENYRMGHDTLGHRETTLSFR